MRKGLTLIELLVAVAIFSVVIIITMSSFSMAIRAQKKVISLQSIQENAKFILEFIAKEIRMSVIDRDSPNGLSNNLSVTRSSNDEVVSYSFANGNLTRNGVLMNSESINITGSFYIGGVGDTDNLQPKLTITMKLKGLGDSIEEEVTINTQATLSQRLLDF